MRRYFSSKTNLGKQNDGVKRRNEGRIRILSNFSRINKWECSLSRRNFEFPKKERVQSKKIQWSGINWEPSEAESVGTRNKT